jgi:hypothetical protein
VLAAPAGRLEVPTSTGCRRTSTPRCAPGSRRVCRHPRPAAVMAEIGEGARSRARGRSRSRTPREAIVQRVNAATALCDALCVAIAAVGITSRDRALRCRHAKDYRSPATGRR